jgi:hypothetical protein
MLPAPLALAVASLALASALPCQANPIAADRAEGAAAVTVEHCEEWLGTLASPEFEGRGTGQEGFRKAAEYVRAHFQRLGLRPLGDDPTFLQAVPWRSAKTDLAKTAVSFVAEGGGTMRIPGERLSGQASQSMRASGPAVLLVLAAPDQEEQPEPATLLEGMDLDKKVVVLRLPQDRPRNFSTFRTVAAVREKGAAAVLLADIEPVRGGVAARSSPGRGGANRAVRGAHMTQASVRFGGDDLTALLHLANAPEALAKPGLTDLALNATVEVVVDAEDAPAFNVFGVLPGSDEELAQEYVVIGSHLDHLGRRGNTVYPGADDDASGTTGVMAVAAMFASNPVRPRRSILFVCFCGEENGLVGSAYFADHPPIPLESIVAELQMDMIGRNEESEQESANDNRNSLHLVGTEKLSADLHELCLARNATAGFDLEWDQEDVFFRSDHASFAKKGIPIAFFFTGFHRDYHRPSDTPDKIDYPKLLRVANYVYDIAFELGTMSSRPLVDPELWAKNRRRLNGPDTPAAPMRSK